MLRYINRYIRRCIIHLNSSSHKPLASEVLTCHLKRCPHWTSFVVYQSSVINDQFGMSHFNWEVDGKNYCILRTGCYPFLKYHCSGHTVRSLEMEDMLLTTLKFVNLGIPCLMYGLVTFCFAKVSEEVMTSKGIVTLYFAIKENRNNPY